MKKIAQDLMTSKKKSLSTHKRKGPLLMAQLPRKIKKGKTSTSQDIPIKKKLKIKKLN